MSAEELAWRVRSLVRDATDLVRLPLHLFPRPKLPTHAKSHECHLRGFSILPFTLGDGGASLSLDSSFQADLIRQADNMLQHEFTFFDLKSKYLGDPIDWHKDHSSGKCTSLSPSPLINYRKFQKVGDCKLVWEPNRHHHLVTLARAWLVSGNKQYADEVAAQLESWLAQNPFGYGMNWRSPLELGVRVINWVWSLDMIKDSHAISNELWSQLYRCAYLHCWDIARKYSQGSSANNHLIGEAAGVYIAASYFHDFPGSKKLRLTSKAILEREILAQSYDDGCNREQALGYQFFVMQFFTFAALVADRTGEPMSSEYLDRLHAQYQFIAKLSDGGQTLPMFGDGDDGYVLDLGDGVDSTDSVLAVGACLFDDPDLAIKVRKWPESPAWLFPGDTIKRMKANVGKLKNAPLANHAFKQAGYYLLQGGDRDCNNSISLLFDCGDLGFGSLAAHGHADALSFSLRLGGTPFLVDPGTYDYFTYPEWRNYFRSTRAHNTIEVDNVSQSRITGLFMWGNHAASRCQFVDLNSQSPTVSGSHDGYESLRDAVRITRTINLDKEIRRITIRDDLTANYPHVIAAHFHLNDRVEIKRISANSFRLLVGNIGMTLTLDASLDTSVTRADATSPLGWVSPGYHTRTKSHVISATRSIAAKISLVHTIDIM